MGLKLEKGLKHQTEAVERISSVFENVPIHNTSCKYANPIINLTSSVLLNNIKSLNKTLPISNRGQVNIGEYLNIDIKMETGTGKTYVYTKTIFDLNKKYGIHKFIILVPSLPIKLGTINFIKSDEAYSHFKDQYDNKSIDLYILNAKKNKKGKETFPSAIRGFVETSELIKNRISVLLVNMQLFKDNSMLTKDYASTVEDYSIPSEAIIATKPFIIIDEPHRFSKGNKTFEYIENKIKPQCIIRFGATFPDVKNGKNIEKDYHNLIYNLGSCDAFNNNLVKGVKVKYLDSPDGNNKKLKVLSLENKKKARLELISDKNKKTFELEKGDSLKQIDESFENVFIEGIGKSLFLSNGQELNKGSEIFTDIYSTSYQTVMIENALDAHFKTEKENFKRNDIIKTLALFFIDDIDSYRENKQNPQPTYLKDIFEKLLKKKILKELSNINENDEKELLYKKYLEDTIEDISSTHGGYFAKDNNDSDDNIAEEISQILVNKEQTLSIYRKNGKFNTFRFIFSKWTLKEGWDNPNVFTIVKLRSSGSENSKIQEVGRGLRLPVDEFGNRISNEEFMLNYIVDFTEADFANRLVAEINAELPAEQATHISTEELERVAKLRNVDTNQFMIELMTKSYIDFSRKINIDKINDFYQDYPEFNMPRLAGTKVIDKNKQKKNTVKVREARFNELKELWAAINKKYVLFFDNDVEQYIDKDIQTLLKDGVFGLQEITTDRQTIKAGKDNVEVVGEAGVTYFISGRKLPYNAFLKRINKATSIPINTLHNAISIYAKSKNGFNQAYINESSAARFISKFNDWKYENLKGRFNYKQTEYTPTSTKLTNADGSVRDEVVLGDIGTNLLKGEPSAKYLYDVIAYDSPLECKNIMEDIQEVVVYGKIPRRSISIPTIGNDTYSPDFMYVVKKASGEKELNIVIETKQVEGKSSLRGEEAMKISCAEEFFNQLTLDGYKVSFKTQLNNNGVKSIIEEIVKGK